MWQLPPFWRASIAVDIAAIAGAVGMPIMGADIVTGGAITNAAGVEVVAGVVVHGGVYAVFMDVAGKKHNVVSKMKKAGCINKPPAE